MSVFLAGIGGKILMGLMAAGLVIGGYFYWEHVVTSRKIIALQRDQLAEAVIRHRQEVADKNRIWAAMLALPDGRTRLCAMQGPSSGCCRPEPAECAP